MLAHIKRNVKLQIDMKPSQHMNVYGYISVNRVLFSKSSLMLEPLQICNSKVTSQAIYIIELNTPEACLKNSMGNKGWQT